MRGFSLKFQTMQDLSSSLHGCSSLHGIFSVEYSSSSCPLSYLHLLPYCVLTQTAVHYRPAAATPAQQPV